MPLHVKVVDVLEGPRHDHVRQDLQLRPLDVSLAELGFITLKIYILFTLMTTLGVMTWAEVGSFLLATTSLMNSANLTTSTST